MSAKKVGELLEAGNLPVELQRFGETKDELFPDLRELRDIYGNEANDFSKVRESRPAENLSEEEETTGEQESEMTGDMEDFLPAAFHAFRADNRLYVCHSLLYRIIYNHIVVFLHQLQFFQRTVYPAVDFFFFLCPAVRQPFAKLLPC